jgi:hypothetical protein
MVTSFTVRIPPHDQQVLKGDPDGRQIEAHSPEEAARLVTGLDLVRTGRRGALRVIVTWSEAGLPLQKVQLYERQRGR